MNQLQLPDRAQALAKKFLTSGASPVAPRNAATTILLRPGAREEPGGIELFLIRRHAGMAFAPSVAAFPGGSVDPRDLEEGGGARAHDWIGPSAEEWAARLGTTPDVARGVVCAAVRETFEESGVLFAGESDESVVPSTADADWERDRQRLEAHELSLSELLHARGLRLRTDLLRVWRAWTTPEFEPKRYRTWFFVAEVPVGQETRDVSSESDGIAWTPVREALRAAGTETRMLPPQYCTCLELFEYKTPADVLRAAEQRSLEHVTPSVTLAGERVRLVLPPKFAELAQSVTPRL